MAFLFLKGKNQAFFIKLAVKEPKPPSKPPTKPVTINKIVELPLNGRIDATFLDNKCSFGMSFSKDKITQRKKSARKPDKKEATGFCLNNTETTKATATKPYQGKKLINPKSQLNKAIIIIERKNFILIILVVNVFF